MVRLEAWIHGKVQGVWYRASTRDQAATLPVSGWVANRPDGSVQLVAEGPREALDALLRWCRQGPPAAEVERVEFEWGEATGAFDGFEIRR